MAYKFNADAAREVLSLWGQDGDITEEDLALHLESALDEIERLHEPESAAKRDVRILVLHEKHGDRLFDVSTSEMLDAAALAIVKERLDEGWYDDEDAARAALLGGDRALQFLRGRRRAEYEGFDLVTPEVAANRTRGGE